MARGQRTFTGGWLVKELNLPKEKKVSSIAVFKRELDKYMKLNTYE